MGDERPEEIEKYPRVGVGSLICNNYNKIFMVRLKVSPEMWTIPRGYVKFGEIIEDALMREAKENTGLYIHDFEFAAVQQFIYSGMPEKKHTVCVDFFCRGDGEVRANEKFAEHKWYSPFEAFSSLDMYLADKELIGKFVRIKTKITV